MSSSRSLELVRGPEQSRLVALEGLLDARRDTIAELDEQIEALREELADFEAHYRLRLAAEEDRVTRLAGLVRHVERWLELLSEAPREQVVVRGQRLEQRRTQEAAALYEARRRQEASEAAAGADPPDAPGPPSRADRPEALKLAYRRLVRRFHPDLAQSEEERLRCVTHMQRINALYRAGDLGRLQALADQEGSLDDLDTSLPLVEQVKLLEERLAWFDAVLENLQEELQELHRCELNQLRERAAERRVEGGDLLEELRQELRERLRRRRRDVAWIYDELERAVKRYNHDDHPLPASTTTRAGALERLFDPLADRPLVRLGLESLETADVRPAVRQRAEWVESLADGHPALLRLLLFAHVGERSHLPLPGLETYEDLKVRFESLAAEDDASEAAPTSLEETLAGTTDLVEYGVRRATEQLVYLGLRFRSEATREAMPLALQAAPVRRAFRQVLKVLGEHTLCPGCGRDTFAIPLYRTRGLDDLRATVCPACGHVHQRYYLPKGDDVQTILNRAYLELELVVEWSFRLARASFHTQLLPVEVDNATVGDLKARLVQDLLKRYELGITRGQVELRQDDRRVPEKTPLATLASPALVVRFRPGAPLSEADAVELLRHRIRNRFK